MKGADTMRFLAIQPKTMPGFDRNAPSSLPAARRQRAVVILCFEALGDRTRVTLRQVGRSDPAGVDGAERDASRRHFDRASDTVLGNPRRRYAADGEPRDWTGWLERMKGSD